MTIFTSKTVKLRDINTESYVPKSGIDVIWQKLHGEQYATFTAGDLNSPQYVTDRHDINKELTKLKVIQDTIKDYYTYNKVRPKGYLRRTLTDDGNKMVEDKG